MLRHAPSQRRQCDIARRLSPVAGTSRVPPSCCRFRRPSECATRCGFLFSRGAKQVDEVLVQLKPDRVVAVAGRSRYVAGIFRLDFDERAREPALVSADARRMDGNVLNQSRRQSVESGQAGEYLGVIDLVFVIVGCALAIDLAHLPVGDERFEFGVEPQSALDRSVAGWSQTKSRLARR